MSTRFNSSAVPAEVCLPSLASLIAQRTVAPPTQPANPWRAMYDPAGGYRIVYEPNPTNPPVRRGTLLWRATYKGARQRVAELNTQTAGPRHHPRSTETALCATDSPATASDES